jgi:hypothetical protein
MNVTSTLVDAHQAIIGSYSLNGWVFSSDMSGTYCGNPAGGAGQ